MDSLSTKICSGIVTDIMEDVENIVDIENDGRVAAPDKNKDNIGKDEGGDSVEGHHLQTQPMVLVKAGFQKYSLLILFYL